MKLHYSQTKLLTSSSALAVSVPYEITLLSNCKGCYRFDFRVSVPYEITLLSNVVLSVILGIRVSVPYEITLLSNGMR